MPEKRRRERTQLRIGSVTTVEAPDALPAMRRLIRRAVAAHYADAADPHVPKATLDKNTPGSLRRPKPFGGFRAASPGRPLAWA